MSWCQFGDLSFRIKLEILLLRLICADSPEPSLFRLMLVWRSIGCTLATHTKDYEDKSIKFLSVPPPSGPVPFGPSLVPSPRSTYLVELRR